MNILHKTKLEFKSICRFFYFRIMMVNKKMYLKYFCRKYRDKLSDINIHGVKADRYIGFKKIFEELLNKKSKNFTIIETGCARREDWGDGRSSLLFYEFLSIFGGKLISIDIDRNNLDTCRKILQNNIPKTGKAKFYPMLGNSINILSNIKEEADLLYLDSFDLDKDNPEPSMRHHLVELKNSRDIICRSKNLLLAVDDNLKALNFGKGKYILEWALNTNQRILLDGYQIIIRVDESRGL